MKVTSYAVARPAAFDRNPVQTVKSVTVYSDPPAGFTVRWTYTVPAGKRALITSGTINIQRYTVATVVGQLQYMLAISPLGSGRTGFMGFYDNDNTVNRALRATIGQGPLLNAADVVEALTADSCTGGTNNVWISATFTEFDA